MTTFSFILIILAIAVIAFYVWGMKYVRKSKDGKLKFVAPFLINAISSCMMFYMVMLWFMAWTHEVYITTSGFVMIFLPLILQTIANILVYFLYYKKKKKLTGKEYFLTSLAGCFTIIVYMAYLELNTYLRFLFITGG